ncbi:peptidylprolyl isomerase [Peribacillus sp. NPDC097295]|uniref:peptidylprolyl isomerase n=1 Tax=Peribacillus sp. NPDC097295 TaxID=3364402 RepID=UPI00382AC440
MNVLKSKKAYVWATAILIIAAILIYAMVVTSDKTVASVGGEKIKEAELHDTLVKNYGAETVNQLITDKIVELEADKEGIKVTDKEIQKEIDTLAESYGGEEKLKEQLKASGSSLAEFKQDIVAYLHTKKLVEPRITVTDDEISAYFEENKDTFAQEAQVEASHILVEDKKTAEKVEKELAAGGDFAELATKYSTDAGTKEKGGSLGYFGKGSMVAEFEDVAFNMDVNEISDPVKTEYGYHIIKVTGEKKAKKANLEDNKQEIKEALLNNKLQEEYAVWLEEVKKDYDISNTFEATE